MIIDFKKQNLEIEKTTDVENDIEMTFDKDSLKIQFQMFINNIYSNPIGSIVREVTSNSIDSHIEAGVDEPVVIRLTKENDECYISFIDNGVGMSFERIKVYCSFLSSTKTTNNNQIGGWGVGGKSILSYKRSTGEGNDDYDNSYHIITKHDNYEHGYYVYEGKDKPIVTKLYVKPTMEHNGTEIKIPVLSEDIHTFIREFKKQLYYFDNIVFDGFEDYDNNLNTYKIVDGENFKYRGNEYDDFIHISLGNVAYPIDYNAIHVSKWEYQIPVAIKLSVGDIGVTVSRESIDYTKKTIKLIKNKLEAVKEEVFNLFNKQNDSIVTFEDYFKIKTTNNNLVFFDNGLSLNIKNILDTNKIKFKNFIYENIIREKTSLNDLITFLFDVINFPKNNKLSKTPFNVNNNISYLYLLEDKNKLKRTVNGYLKRTNGGFFRVISKNNQLQYFMGTLTFGKLFNDQNTTINDLIKIQNDLFNIFKKTLPIYDDIIVSKTKKQQNKYKENDLIPVNFIVKNSSNRSNIKISELLKFNGAIYYGTPDEYNELQTAATITDLLFYNINVCSNYNDYNSFQYQKQYNNKKIEKSKIAFISISKVNAKKIKKFKHFHSIDTFRTNMLKRKTNVFDLLQEISFYNGITNTYSEETKIILDDNFKDIDNNTYKLFQEIDSKQKSLKEKLSSYNISPVLIKYNEMPYVIQEYLNKYSNKNIESKLKKVDVLNEKIKKINNAVNKYAEVLRFSTYKDIFWTVFKEIYNNLIKIEFEIETK